MHPFIFVVLLFFFFFFFFNTTRDNAFINLNDYLNNSDQLVDDLKNEDFLIHKASQPLILKDQNLNKEFEIIEKILKDFN